jgi:D-mannonate dehydratase
LHRYRLDNVNFDESSDDDEDAIALPHQRGRGTTARKAAAMAAGAAGERGKARKKLKEKVAKKKKLTDKLIRERVVAFLRTVVGLYTFNSVDP